MTQAHLNKTNFKLLNDSNFSFYLDPEGKTKSVTIHYSTYYKDYVLTIHLNKYKFFVITPPMWEVLISHLELINNVLSRTRNNK